MVFQNTQNAPQIGFALTDSQGYIPEHDSTERGVALLRLRSEVCQRAQVDIPRACSALARRRANVDLYVRISRLGLCPDVPVHICPDERGRHVVDNLTFTHQVSKLYSWENPKRHSQHVTPGKKKKRKSQMKTHLRVAKAAIVVICFLVC